LGVRREHLADRVLKLPPGLDAPAHLLHPVLRDVLDMLFPLDHEGEGPDGMSLALGAMTGGLAATKVAEGEGAGKEILGDAEAPNELEFSLAQLRG